MDIDCNRILYLLIRFLSIFLSLKRGRELCGCVFGIKHFMTEGWTTTTTSLNKRSLIRISTFLLSSKLTFNSFIDLCLAWKQVNSVICSSRCAIHKLYYKANCCWTNSFAKFLVPLEFENSFKRLSYDLNILMLCKFEVRVSCQTKQAVFIVFFKLIISSLRGRDCSCSLIRRGQSKWFLSILSRTN